MRCVIAGGGTGGIFSRALPLPRRLLRGRWETRFSSSGQREGSKSRVLAGGRFPLKTIRAMPLKGRSARGKDQGPVGHSQGHLGGLVDPEGFQASGRPGSGRICLRPALLAAFLLRIKRAIHEQNMVPGMTNRILKWFSQRIFVSFEETKQYFPERKTGVTGNPIRKEFLAGLKRRSDRRTEGDRFTLLVFGGSAGAHRINEAMMEALDFLGEVRPSLRFIHQTGREDFEFVSKGYQEKGLMRWSDLSSRIWRASIRPLIWSSAGQGQARLPNWRSAERRPS